MGRGRKKVEESVDRTSSKTPVTKDLKGAKAKSKSKPGKEDLPEPLTPTKVKAYQDQWKTFGFVPEPQQVDSSDPSTSTTSTSSTSASKSASKSSSSSGRPSDATNNDDDVKITAVNEPRSGIHESTADTIKEFRLCFFFLVPFPVCIYLFFILIVIIVFFFLCEGNVMGRDDMIRLILYKINKLK